MIVSEGDVGVRPVRSCAPGVTIEIEPVLGVESLRTMGVGAGGKDR